MDSKQNTVYVLIMMNGVSITSTKKLILKNLQGLKEVTYKMRTDGIIPQFANIVWCYAMQLTKIGQPE